MSQRQVYKPKNQGVAITRNVGLAHATGKYIGFVDSDDIVCTDYFTILLPKLREEKYDILEFNLTRDIKICIRTHLV